MLGQYTAFLACSCILSIPLWAPCRLARVWSSSSWGMQMQLPLRSRLASMDSLYQASQRCLVILRTCCQQTGHPLRVRQYSTLYTGSHSMEPQMASSLAVNNCTCWMFCATGMGRDSLWEGRQLRWSANTISLPGVNWMV